MTGPSVANLAQARTLLSAPLPGATLASPFYGILPPEFIDRVKDYFTFEVDLLPVPAGATLLGNFTVSNDAGFLIGSINAFVTDPADESTVIAVEAAPLTIIITDSGSGREIMSNPVPIANLCGRGSSYGLMYWPKFIPPASNVKVTVANLDAANPYNVRLSFAGFKVFGSMAQR